MLLDGTCKSTSCASALSEERTSLVCAECNVVLHRDALWDQLRKKSSQAVSCGLHCYVDDVLS